MAVNNLGTLAEELAGQIKAARTASNLTQAEFAADLGVSMRTVQGWEAGVTFPRPAHRRRLAQFFQGLQATA